MREFAKTIRRNREGATFVEFALISPVLLIALMGGMDAAFNAYTTVVLRGAVADAARDATIEAADSGALDNAVSERLHQVLPTAQVTFSRKTYDSFSLVGTPEDFSDLDSDGVCNNGEPFEDSNGNGLWDMDRGQSGNGGARDVVEYMVSMSYDRLFPAPALIGLPEQFSVTETTLLRNQPYTGSRTAPATGTCA